MIRLFISLPIFMLVLLGYNSSRARSLEIFAHIATHHQDQEHSHKHSEHHHQHSHKKTAHSHEHKKTPIQGHSHSFELSSLTIIFHIPTVERFSIVMENNFSESVTPLYINDFRLSQFSSSLFRPPIS